MNNKNKMGLRSFPWVASPEKKPKYGGGRQSRVWDVFTSITFLDPEVKRVFIYNYGHLRV